MPRSFPVQVIGHERLTQGRTHDSFNSHAARALYGQTAVQCPAYPGIEPATSETIVQSVTATPPRRFLFEYCTFIITFTYIPYAPTYIPCTGAMNSVIISFCIFIYLREFLIKVHLCACNGTRSVCMATLNDPCIILLCYYTFVLLYYNTVIITQRYYNILYCHCVMWFMRYLKAVDILSCI